MCIYTREAILASDMDTIWNIMASIIKDGVKDTLSVAIGTFKTHTTYRKSWCPCEDVQSKVVVKQARFREFLCCKEGNQEEWLRVQEKYKEAKKEAKKVVPKQNKRQGREEAIDPSLQPQFECYYSRIRQAVVRVALKKMGIIKDVGPNQIPMEAWRNLGDVGIFWLTSLCNKTFTSAKMHEE
nr:RNA-directed DNA polymerase [Tanacetum cinerariifolium]